MNKKILITSIAAVAVLAVIIAVAVLWPEEEPYDYDLSEYVIVGDYKGLEYTVEEVSVTDDEVDEEIESRLQAAATTETVTEGTVEDGDTINVSYEGTIDGETFDGGSSDSFDITIGTTSMIDGFTDGLIGHEVGETVTLDLTFPDDYDSEELAGEDVIFTVTINSKSVEVVPELDEDFVQENSDVDTVEEYWEAVKEELLVEKQNEADLDLKEAIWDQLISNAEVISYPEKEYNIAMAAAEEIEAEYMAQAESYGMEWVDFLNQILGLTEEEFEESKVEYAEDTVLQEMVMYYIAREENLEITDEEYDEYLAEVLEYSGYTEDTFEQLFGMTIKEYADASQWRIGLLLDKVLDKVIEYGVQVDSTEE